MGCSFEPTSHLRSPRRRESIDGRTTTSVEGSIHLPDKEGILTAAHEIFERAFAIHSSTARVSARPPISSLVPPSEYSSLATLAQPPDRPTSIENVVDVFHDQIAQYRLPGSHPRMMGFIPSPHRLEAVIADLAVSALNVHAGSWLQSSGMSAIEDGLVKWMAEKAGFRDEEENLFDDEGLDGEIHEKRRRVGGLFVSGGSMANLTALTCARDQKLRTWEDRGKGVAYVSEQTHGSVEKGLRILGFDTRRQVRVVPSDAHFRLDIAALERAIDEDIRAGLRPFLIVGSCGTTNTGAIDPMREISDICQRRDLWMHIDGAYGASIVLSPTHKHLAHDLGLADSLSWDAHKWLFCTYGLGMVIVRDRRHLVESFRSEGGYLKDAVEDGGFNFWNMGMELTRPARGMRLWFLLQVLGMEKIAKMIDHGVKLAKVAEEALRRRNDWEIVSNANLGIVTFRFVPWHSSPSETDLDLLNAEISKRVVANNVACILTTKIRGRVVLRICSINPELSLLEMEEIICELDTTARRVLKDSR